MDLNAQRVLCCWYLATVVTPCGSNAFCMFLGDGEHLKYGSFGGLCSHISRWDYRRVEHVSTTKKHVSSNCVTHWVEHISAENLVSSSRCIVDGNDRKNEDARM